MPISTRVRGAYIVGCVLILLHHGASRATCTDADGDGFFYEDGCGTARDCNDAAAGRFPGAVELCNGFDDDCDGALDEGCETECGYPFREGADILVDLPPQSDEPPGAVWNGAGYAVAWNRYESDYVRTIRLARLDPAGAVIGITQVSDATGVYRFGDVVWTGTEYGVVWDDGEVRFARVDAGGARTGAEQRVSDAEPATSDSAALAWSGHEYGVAWHDRRDGSDQVYFTRLDANGMKIGGDLRVSAAGAAPSTSEIPGIAWSGAAWAISWGDSRDGNEEVYVARLDANGIKLGQETRLTVDPATSQSPTIVWNGSEYGVAWFDSRTGIALLHFARMDVAGIKVGGDVRVPDAFASKAAYAFLRPSLVWTGSEWIAAWTDTRYPGYEVYAGRIDASGTKLGDDTLLTAEPSLSFGPAIAWNGANMSVAWLDIRIGPPSMYFGRVGCCDAGIDADDDGSSQCGDCDEGDARVHPGAEEQCDFKDNDCDRLVDEGFDQDGDGFTTCSGDCADSDPDVAGAWEVLCDGIDEGCDGPEGEVVDTDGDGWDACGSGDALNPDGRARDCNDHDFRVGPNATEVCFNAIDDDCDGIVDEGCSTRCDSPQRNGPEHRVTQNQASDFGARLVSTGSDFGVFWKRSGVMFQRVTATGESAGAAIELVSRDEQPGYPEPSWTGLEYGVCWGYASIWGSMYAERFDRDGSAVGAASLLGSRLPSAEADDAVWTGREYGVVWTDTRTGKSAVHFARLDGSMRKIGVEAVLNDPAGTAYEASLVWTGAGYGVAWTDTSAGNPEIYFARLDGEGQLVGTPSRITVDAAVSRSASLAWTGTAYSVAWQDARFGGTSNVYFARIDAEGNKVGTDVRVTSFGYPVGAFAPRLAWTGSEYGVAWSDTRNLILNEEIYFARLDANGAKLGSDVRVSAANSTSREPFLVWTGDHFGVTWWDDRGGDAEIYFARIDCCGEDRDGDGFNGCADCVDTNSEIRPNAAEVCDRVDNDCDGAVDEGFVAPPAVGSITFDADKHTLRWSPVASADRYDVERGSLDTLRASNGDFAAAITECLEDDSADTSALDAAEPAIGEGVLYLARAQAACLSGSYDSGSPGQSGSRDAEIEASGAACP